MLRLLVLVVILLLQSSLVYAADNVAYQKLWVQNVPAHVVTANLNSPNVNVSPAIARYGIGTSEGYGSMLSRLQPSASITGTYFCMRSLSPIGDIVINGRLVHFGPTGTGVCITPDNKVEFRPTRYGRTMDWSAYSSVLCTGPRLVTNGTTSVAPWAEGFTDPSLYRRSQRAAIGVTGHNKLLLVTVNRPIFLSDMARIMRDLGTVDAVSLDGGSSTALSYRDRVFSHPGRRLTNVVVVYESPAQFSRIRSQLAPSHLAGANLLDF